MLHNNPFTNYIQGHCQLGKFLSAVIYKQACFAKIILSYDVVNKRVRLPSRLGLHRWVCPLSIRRLYACGSRGVVRASNPSYPTPTHLSNGWKFKFLKLFFNLPKKWPRTHPCNHRYPLDHPEINFWIRTLYIHVYNNWRSQTNVTYLV